MYFRQERAFFSACPWRITKRAADPNTLDRLIAGVGALLLRPRRLVRTEGANPAATQINRSTPSFLNPANSADESEYPFVDIPTMRAANDMDRSKNIFEVGEFILGATTGIHAAITLRLAAGSAAKGVWSGSCG